MCHLGCEKQSKPTSAKQSVEKRIDVFGNVFCVFRKCLRVDGNCKQFTVFVSYQTQPESKKPQHGTRQNSSSANVSSTERC